MAAVTAEAQAEATTQLPLFEGQRVTDHAINFSGDVAVKEQDLVKAMKLNAEVEVVVRGRIVSRKHGVARDSEGNVIGTKSSSTILVESVELSA